MRILRELRELKELRQLQDFYKMLRKLQEIKKITILFYYATAKLRLNSLWSLNCTFLPFFKCGAEKIKYSDCGFCGLISKFAGIIVYGYWWEYSEALLVYGVLIA